MKKKKKSPFFAKFLESQKINQEKQVTGGSTTPRGDLLVTLKYPSDGEY